MHQYQPHSGSMTRGVTAWWIVVFTLQIICFVPADSANILAICTVVSHSHSLWCYQFMSALIERGHHVTVFGVDKPKKLMANLTTFVAEGVYESTYNTEVTDSFTNSKSIVNCLTESFLMQHKLSTPTTLRSEGFRSLLKKYENITKPFDLIIHDHIMCFACVGLVHHFGNPPLLLATVYGAPELWTFYNGNFLNPAYVPNILLPYDQRMTFYERFHNMFIYLLSYNMFLYQLIPFNDQLMKEVFGPDVPSVVDIAKQANIVMVNHHFAIDGPIPLSPGVVPIPGLHVDETQQLPEELKNFMDSANNGVILISFGSNVGKTWLPESLEETLMNAFRDFPQKILWKWDGIPSDLPSNMNVGKWFPQNDILAHPNIRLFVTHCGSLSLQEAIFHGVPLLSLPVFIDQHANAERMQRAGAALTEDVNTVTADQLRQTALELLQNKQYKTNMEKLSELMRDTPLTPKQQAVFWTEYVIRHAGASHLRSAAADMPLHQLLLLDVFVVLILVALASLWVVKFTASLLLRVFFGFRQKTKVE